MPDPINRIRDHLSCQCGSRIKAPPPSIGDKMLGNAHRVRVELWRFEGGDLELEYEVRGSLSSAADDDDGDTLAVAVDEAALLSMAGSLLRQFAKREGGDR
jgi:hypothetical protein